MTASEARAKVAKLRALASDPAAAPGEKANASRMADRLTERHGLNREAPNRRPTGPRVYSTAGQCTPPRQRVWSSAMPVAEDTPAFDAFFRVAPGQGQIFYVTPDGQMHDTWPGGTCRIVVG